MFILIVSFTIALLDQWTKNLVRAHLPLGGYSPVIPGFFDIRYIQNTGAAWGMLEGLNHWLVLFSVVMLFGVVVFRKHLLDHRWISHIALASIIGGITGNLIDRVHLGFVVDFLHFYVGAHQFPAFNVADSAICIGAGLFMFSQAFPSREQSPDAASASSSTPAHE